MPQVNLILTCASNKVLKADDSLSLVNYPKKEINPLASSWISNLQNPTLPSLPALDMYSGNYWNVVKNINSLPNVKDIWVISAGYGLIHINDYIHSYNIGFKDKSLNSLKLNLKNPPSQFLSDWWRILTTHTNSITDIFKSEEKYILFSSFDYMKAIKYDVENIITSKNLFIVSPDTKIKSLNPYILNTPSTLRYALGGNKMTSSIRVVEHLVKNSKLLTDKLTIDNYFQNLLNSTPIPILPKNKKRRKIGDKEMVKLIKEVGINSPHQTIFNYIRSKDIAAGEARIIRLIHKHKL
tara:strand:- start:3141 stop:4028 length:888 start_codon:yes stop_codon:yes gene_type:complete